MIKSITLKNFFSFEEQTVRLNPKVNLLVGINGSGKSNFIKAFELLRFGINEGVPIEKINKWGGLGKVRNYSNIKADKVGIELILDSASYNQKEGDNLHYELFAIREEDDYNWSEKILTHKNGEENILGEGHVNKAQLFDIEWITGNQTLEMLEHYLRQIVVYEQIDISENGVKKRNQLKRNGLEKRLSVDFKNLAPLIYSFKRTPETRDVFDKIQAALGKVNVNFGDVNFDAEKGILNMYITDRRKELLLGLDNISSGTLKFLTLMSILYNPNRGSIVCIEEPEDGLHPDMINTVAKGIKHASKTSQMIISTHSPFLLNSFELEDILVFENDKNNNTIVKELSQDDFGEWADDFLVGQLWLNGLIGGKRW